MFTGIIKEFGKVLKFVEKPYGLSVTLQSHIFQKPQIDSSFAINGVCLTQVYWEPCISCFDVTHETLKKTTLGDLKEQQHVHVEEALSAQSKIEGHFVQGHVDGVAIVIEVNPEKLVVRLPDALEPFLIEKGSIAIDGVSLTIACLEKNLVEVALIPHTFQNTLFKTRSLQDKVNIEIDMFAKMMFKYFDKLPLKKALS